MPDANSSGAERGKATFGRKSGDAWRGRGDGGNPGGVVGPGRHRKSDANDAGRDRGRTSGDQGKGKRR